MVIQQINYKKSFEISYHMPDMPDFWANSVQKILLGNVWEKILFLELFWNYEKLFTVASTIAVSANADWTQPTYRDAMAMSKQRGANWGFPGHGHKGSNCCQDIIEHKFWPLFDLSQSWSQSLGQLGTLSRSHTTIGCCRYHLSRNCSSLVIVGPSFD